MFLWGGEEERRAELAFSRAMGHVSCPRGPFSVMVPRLYFLSSQQPPGGPHGLRNQAD